MIRGKGLKKIKWRDFVVFVEETLEEILEEFIIVICIDASL